MPTLERLRPAGAPVVGQTCTFAVVGGDAASVVFFLEHQGILYPTPLPPSRAGAVDLFLEVPGQYRLHAQWTTAAGDRGGASAEFTASGPYVGVPRLASIGGGVDIWTPSTWDAQLLGAHESATLRELAALVRPGAVVYDIGANVGVFAVNFARAVGSRGHVYAIEPNPVCVYFLRANLEHAQLGNFTILPVAISRRAGDCGFSLNYGSSMLGVGQESPFAGKHGHRISVGADSLDALIATMGLRPPDFIKLDVEGAEGAAMAGMLKTIATARPALMLELHGRTAARDTLAQLAPLGYRYRVPASGDDYARAEDLAGAFPDACVQIIGTP